jgi:hypothetical protein
MATNFYIYFITALIPLLVGFVYYHEKLLGNIWMTVNGFKKEDLEKGNMLLVFGLVYVFGLMLSFFLSNIVIHQANVASILMPEVMDKSTGEYQDLVAFMTKYGERYRSFKHGALHGGITSIFFILPIIAINALFEKRGWKYIVIHTGYWFITCLLIGGVLCQTLKFDM